GGGAGRLVTDAALRRAARDGVRDAIALEDAYRIVVHPHGHGDLDALLHTRQDADQVRVDGKDLADVPQLRMSEIEGILAEVRRRLGRAHRPAPPSVTSAEYTSLPPGSSDVEPYRLRAGFPGHGGRLQTNGVRPPGQLAAARPAARQPERVLPGEQIADTRDRPEQAVTMEEVDM